MREGGRRESLGEGDTGVREIKNIQEETEAGAGGMVREKGKLGDICLFSLRKHNPI